MSDVFAVGGSPETSSSDSKPAWVTMLSGDENAFGPDPNQV